MFPAPLFQSIGPKEYGRFTVYRPYQEEPINRSGLRSVYRRQTLKRGGGSVPRSPLSERRAKGIRSVYRLPSISGRANQPFGSTVSLPRAHLKRGGGSVPRSPLSEHRSKGIRSVYRLPSISGRANQSFGSTVSLPQANIEARGRECSPLPSFRASVQRNTVGLPSTVHIRKSQSIVRVYGQSTAGKH
ncbi:hypothetical protein GOX2695 (plasmid) [Gluconobacter oxydans 621H]|uniref:Uncharacterized protein n=1 Tax=Gluconobacter oxydans (strain 621H) TaxID=290633 RepID=Q5HXJ4_GLUOX|nr:hypothetical protein GOX2695 [Gluconobacter oxydans 621H]